MAATEALKEAAFETFKAEFLRNGFKVPEGLVYLLANYKLREGETPVAGRARLYRNVFLKLWHGSGKMLGAEVGCQPTYVFPSTLKRVVREIIPGCPVEKPDPTHAKVYKVNIGDLSKAKWPAIKTREMKSKGKKK